MQWPLHCCCAKSASLPSLSSLISVVSPWSRAAWQRRPCPLHDPANACQWEWASSSTSARRGSGVKSLPSENAWTPRLPFPRLWWVHSQCSVAPVLCTTRLVTGGERKPERCALRRSGVKSLPCERRNPSASVPVPSSAIWPVTHSVV